MHLSSEDLQKQHQNLMVQKNQAQVHYQNIIGALHCVEQQLKEIELKRAEALKEEQQRDNEEW